MQALTISQASRPRFRKRWGTLLEKTAAGLEDGGIVLASCGPELSHFVRPVYISAEYADLFER